MLRNSHEKFLKRYTKHNKKNIFDFSGLLSKTKKPAFNRKQSIECLLSMWNIQAYIQAIPSVFNKKKGQTPAVTRGMVYVKRRNPASSLKAYLPLVSGTEDFYI